MKTNVTIRRTKRSEHLFEKIDQIVNVQSTGNNKLTPVLLDIIELGLKSYQAGNRLECGEVINMNKQNRYHEPTIANEVAKTLYPTLSGLISTLANEEKRKENPNANYLSFYLELRDILSEEHRNFYKFTDEQIKRKVAILSPLIKELVLRDEVLHHDILANNFDKINSLQYIGDNDNPLKQRVA